MTDHQIASGGRQVLELHSKAGSYLYIARSDSEAPVANLVAIRPALYEALGQPTHITVTVEGGDLVTGQQP